MPDTPDQSTPRGRVRRFLDAWESHKSRTDVIYGLAVDGPADPRELLAADLRAVVTDPPPMRLLLVAVPAETEDLLQAAIHGFDPRYLDGVMGTIRVLSSTPMPR